jgi:Ca-activated chloride channel family protein
MDFEYPFMLYLLLFVPVLLFLFWIALRHNKAMRERFGDWAVLQRLVPDFAPKRSPLKFGLVLAAYILLVIAIANPRMGSRTRKVKREGVDIYIALDISRSMWVKDVTPKGMDRLEKARLFSMKLIDELRGNRIGLIFFAGEAFVQMPLTFDYASAQLFLNEGLGDFEITQGTAIGELLELAVKSGQSPENEEKRKQKALIILSDGEDHEKKGQAAAREAKNNGVTTFCIGVGASEGSPIPLTREEQTGYHADKSGKTVQSAADKVWLKQVASAGAGKFFDIEDGNAIIGKLRSELNKLEKEEFDSQNFDEYETYYQWFVFLALALLAAEFVITYRKKTLLENDENPKPTAKSLLDEAEKPIEEKATIEA